MLISVIRGATQNAIPVVICIQSQRNFVAFIPYPFAVTAVRVFPGGKGQVTEDNREC